MKRKNLFIILVIIALVLAGGFYLYAKNQKTQEEKPAEEKASEEVSETETPSVTTEEPATQEKTDSEKKVLMFGRSVMAGWFNYWGSKNLSEVKKQGYTLEYKELASPPDIINSFKESINKLSAKENPTIFFKLCFVDFEGSSKKNAQKNLQRNEKYIEEVYKTTKSKNLKLIVGSALPQVPSSTDSYLKWNHKQYNKWLVDFQKEHKGDVFILDMYDVLSDSSGYLRARYTDDLYDSHPNENAYKALDKEFFKLLKDNF